MVNRSGYRSATVSRILYQPEQESSQLTLSSCFSQRTHGQGVRGDSILGCPVGRPLISFAETPVTTTVYSALVCNSSTCLSPTDKVPDPLHLSPCLLITLKHTRQRLCHQRLFSWTPTVVQISISFPPGVSAAVHDVLPVYPE